MCLYVCIRSKTESNDWFHNLPTAKIAIYTEIKIRQITANHFQLAMHLCNKAYMIDNKAPNMMHFRLEIFPSHALPLVRLPENACTLNYVFRILAFVNKSRCSFAFVVPHQAPNGNSRKALFWVFKPFIWSLDYLNNWRILYIKCTSFNYFHTNHSSWIINLQSANGSSNILNGLRRLTKVFCRH